MLNKHQRTQSGAHFPPLHFKIKLTDPVHPGLFPHQSSSASNPVPYQPVYQLGLHGLSTYSTSCPEPFPLLSEVASSSTADSGRFLLQRVLLQPSQPPQVQSDADLTPTLDGELLLAGLDLTQLSTVPSALQGSMHACDSRMTRVRLDIERQRAQARTLAFWHQGTQAEDQLQPGAVAACLVRRGSTCPQNHPETSSETQLWITINGIILY